VNPELARRFHDRIRDEAAARYGLRSSDLASLDAFENFVYECTSPDGDELIVRVSHSTRRTIDYTRGEVEFVRYLAAAGLPVAKPVLAESGQFVESIDDGEPGHYFVATAFERAPGYVFDHVPLLKEKFWKPELFRELGRIFARLHERARGYTPSSPRLKRQEWHEYDVVDVHRFVPREEIVVRERAASLVARLRTLPRSASEYGVIHADIHPHNFCFHEGSVTVFDFDNAEYAWFVKDIAVILFYVAREEEPAHRDEAAAVFLTAFLAGYREVRPCGAAWLAAIPDMLALQRAMNYALFHQYREPDVSRLSDDRKEAWRRFRRDIEGDVPVLKLDFARF
jgi:Ser/Thr protein kinase RdoA (MazF antagonist)